MMEKIIYWCNRHKKEIPLEEQTDEGCMPCGHMCCCPNTVVENKCDTDFPDYRCDIHGNVVDGAEELAYCSDCKQLVEVQKK